MDTINICMHADEMPLMALHATSGALNRHFRGCEKGEMKPQNQNVAVTFSSLVSVPK